jgi:hypothetical protein
MSDCWLQDALGQPFLVPLTQHGLRARTKAARNNLGAAREAAEKGARSSNCSCADRQACRLHIAFDQLLPFTPCAS